MPILEDGQLFERYRVHQCLGGGVAGESYEAEDRILQRKVTLKLIHPWSTISDSARRQFFREMQGISLLNHPYLATVLDYGEIDGRIYVARRYVSSGSLLSTNGRLWFRPPLAVADAFKYAHQLAQALQYIHQHGYLHGSLTFANILVLRGPNSEEDADYAPFLVADVGLANFVRRFGHPRIETLPVSAAPEQLGKRATPASDQFALAVLLYFWLAGRPPYLGSSQEVEQQKLSETLTPLNMLNPGITIEQNSIMLRALTVYPEDRFPSVLAFTDELLASLSRPHMEAPGTFTLQSQAPVQVPATNPPATSDTYAPVPDEAAVQLTSTEEYAQASAAPTTPVEEVTTPTPAPAPQTQAEPYISAFEQLLARQRTQAESESSTAESNTLPAEQGEAESEMVQQEDFLPFPVLPETPGITDMYLSDNFLLIPPTEPPMADISNISPIIFPVELATESPADNNLAHSTRAFLTENVTEIFVTDTPDIPASTLPTASPQDSTPDAPGPQEPGELATAAPNNELLDMLASTFPVEITELSIINTPDNTTPTFTAEPLTAAAHDMTANIPPAQDIAEPAHNATFDGPPPEFPVEIAADPFTANILAVTEHIVPDEAAITSSDDKRLDQLAQGLAIERSIGSPTADALDILTFEFPGELPIVPTLNILANPVTEAKADALPANSDDVPQDATTSTHEELRASDETEQPPDRAEARPTIPLTDIPASRTTMPLTEGYEVRTTIPLSNANEDSRTQSVWTESTDSHAENANILPPDEQPATTFIIPQRELAAADDASTPAQSGAESTPAQPPVEPDIIPDEPLSPLAQLARQLAEPPVMPTEPTLAPAVPESTPVTSQANEETRDQHATTEIDASKKEAVFTSERSAETRITPPLQETRETVNATYPPIEEAIVAPRLLISSPYTSSSYEFALNSEEVNIGRAGSSDLYLEQDNLTSRHHALIKRVGERVLIFDKHSHNGVFINGQKIEVGRSYELADGDHIGIGNYELIFRSSSGRISQLI